MADGFVKLYGRKLFTSSIWVEDPRTRFVFMCLLASADYNGFVDIPNERAMAHVFNVPLEWVTDALAVLMAPDPGSRSSLHEGRRVLRQGTGWMLPTYPAYRDARSAAQEANRLRQAKWREKRRLKRESRKSKKPNGHAEGRAIREHLASAGFAESDSQFDQQPTEDTGE